MVNLVSTASCRAHGGTDMGSGEHMGSARVLERVGFLSSIVQEITSRIVAARWSAADLAVLAGGVDENGRRLPAAGHVAIKRLGWQEPAPAGMYVPERVLRVGFEHAARLLRLAVHRDLLVRALVATWPAEPAARTTDEWTALWAAVSVGTSKAQVRSRTRQVARYVLVHGKLPVSIADLEAPPRVDGQILLAAADKQLVTLEPTDDGVLLTVKLPTSAHPAKRDWPRVALPVRVPAHAPAHATFHTPTLRIQGAHVRVDLPWSAPLTPAPRAGHVRALGLDWGVNTLLTGVVADLRTDRSGRERVISHSQPLFFNAAGVSAKLMRLRTQRERLAAKADQYTRLGTCPDLLARAAVEHDRVASRLRNLGKTLAWAAARWAVDQAAARGCTVIYLEDLATMETRGLGRAMNRRVGQHVRTAVFDAVRHLAARAGIAVVTVPARGTSSGCPRCRSPLQHVKAPDNPTPGHKWAVCVCGLSSDRDHAAAERIVARGLTGQSATRTRAGRHTISATVDTPVRRVLGKRTSTTHKTSPRTPVRRTAPAPVPSTGTGQRPAGQSPTQPAAIAASRQGLHTRISNAVQTRHGTTRPGSGFHAHVRASPLPRTT